MWMFSLDETVAQCKTPRHPCPFSLFLLEISILALMELIFGGSQPAVMVSENIVFPTANP